jgi:hypothetical protein
MHSLPTLRRLDAPPISTLISPYIIELFIYYLPLQFLNDESLKELPTQHYICTVITTTQNAISSIHARLKHMYISLMMKWLGALYRILIT